MVKKAIIPIAGLGTRFLPLSKVLPKELFPLKNKPVIQYIVEEAMASGIKEIIFVTQPKRKLVLNYFTKKLKSKRILKARYRKHFLSELKNLEKISKKISFSQVFQKKPLGDGHALFLAKKLVGKEPFAALWADDVVESREPCLLQLIKVFEKYKRPIVALYPIPKEKFQFYGMVKVERISNRVYKIKKIIEKPSIDKAPSNLAIVGKYVFTPEIFDWFKKFNQKSGELITDEVLGKAIENGEEIYGYEFKGKWLECGNQLAYSKSNFYLCLKDKKLKKYLKSKI